MRTQTQTQQNTLTDELLNERQMSDLVCHSVRTVQKWRVIGGGPPFYKLGRSVRYRKSDILDWIEAQRKEHTSQCLNV